MAKAIRIMNGYVVNFDGNIKKFKHHNWDQVMDYINMPKDKNLRMDLFTQIFCFGRLDLTDEYQGHIMQISIIPAL